LHSTVFRNFWHFASAPASIVVRPSRTARSSAPRFGTRTDNCAISPMAWPVPTSSLDLKLADGSTEMDWLSLSTQLSYVRNVPMYQPDSPCVQQRNAVEQIVFTKSTMFGVIGV